jgi:hypothetical protein
MILRNRRIELMKMAWMILVKMMGMMEAEEECMSMGNEI